MSEGLMVVVRVAAVGDLGAVLAVERGAATAPHWPEAEYAACLEAAGVGLEEGGGPAPGGTVRLLLVAEVEGSVVGFAVGRVTAFGEERVGELENVAVAEAAQRRGVGRALCRAVMAWCAERGAREIELEVRSQSAGPMALYASLGFVAVGRRTGYYRNPTDDAVLMRYEDQGIGNRE
jgi:ribosomal-protein-alanine N-acetyltransferase